MNKKELAERVAKSKGISRNLALDITNEIFDIIAESMEEEERVQIIGFGTFDIKLMSEKQGRNPHTGERILIPAHTGPTFRAGKQLKDRVTRTI